MNNSTKFYIIDVNSPTEVRILEDALKFLECIKDSELYEQQYYDLKQVEKRIKTVIDYLEKGY